MKRQTRTKMWRNGRNDDHILTVSRSGLGGEKVVFFCRFGRFGMRFSRLR